MARAVEIQPGVRSLPNLRTERLTLRPVAPDDATDFQRLFADPRVATMTDGFAHPYPEGEALRWISRQRASLSDGAGGALAIEQAASVIGHVAIRAEPADRRAEVSYAVAHAHWGSGIATEALREVVRWCFVETDLHRLYALVYVTNAASISVLEKAGFVREGRLRGHALHVDQFEDDYVYGLLREEWEARR